jgi:hypothetical protein
MVQYMMMGELVETPKQILRMLHIAFGRVWEGVPPPECSKLSELCTIKLR